MDWHIHGLYADNGKRVERQLPREAWSFLHGMFLGSCLVYKALLGQGEHVPEKGRGRVFLIC